MPNEPSDVAQDRASALALTPVSRETASRLEQFVSLLLTWQKTTNLIAPASVSGLWTRHVADCLQLLPLAPDARIWTDLGSGGGLPGLVIACALADIPDARVHLVESQGKKAAFLREAIRILGLPATLHHCRIEAFPAMLAGRIDVVTARALAPMVRLLDLAAPLLERGAKGLFPKGQDVEAELTEASKYWTIAAQLVPSKTDAGGRIVVVRHLERLRAARHETD